MSISIVGGCGFLGNRLSKRLGKSKVKYEIFDKKLPKSDNNYIDVTDIDSLDVLKDSSAIINLAAVHRDDIRPISLYDDVNVEGARNICSTAEKFNINKIIFTSSVAVYGFAKNNTKEDGKINYFNHYGRTKYLAEKVYEEWLLKDPENRTLVVVRPTVIFGEGNRGNVFNLLNQIASKKFLMFGSGKNIKSMAYVENVAAFLEYCLLLDKGKHLYNYIDKPDLDMNDLIIFSRKVLFNKENITIRLPKALGICIGKLFDLTSLLSRRNLPISSIRVKKFMSNSQFDTSINKTSFLAPITLEDGLKRTLTYEFIEDNSDKEVFKTE